MVKDEYIATRKYQAEENANRYLIRCMLITFLLYGIAWFLNTINVFIVDSRIMNRGFIAMIFFIVGISILSRLLGFQNPKTKYIIMFFSVVMYTVVVITLSYHVTLIIVFPLLCSVQYSSKKMTVYTYILTLIGIAVSTILGFRYGLCDANMLLLTTTTTSEHMKMLQSGDFGVNSNMGTIWLFFVFPRCMITTAFIPIFNRLRRDIEERAAHEAAAKRRAEVDDMTGLYNKNKYLDMLSGYYPNVERVGVIFWDVNNLKKVNDAYGHEYGDQLIAAVSDSISAFRSDKQQAFRIGGDEFVMICEQPEPGDIEGIISQWKRSLANKVIGDDIPISSAVGFSEGRGLEIDEVIKRADEAMYENKKYIKGNLKLSEEY